MAFTDLPAFQPLAAISVYLVLKMFAIAGITANRRRLSKVVLNPEDTGVNPGSHSEPVEAESTLRAKRAHLNDLENIPGFLVLATIFTLAGATTTDGWAYFGVYAVARTLHSICYLNAIQPWRTASFAIGQLTLVGVCVRLLMLAF